MLTPLVGVTGLSDSPQASIRPDAIDSGVGVVAGDTLKYNIDALTIPGTIPNLTLPDFAGNQIYIKILNVNTSAILPEGTGTLVNYAVGLMFLEAETITVGEGLLAQVFTIPAGTATPSVSLEGNPGFNDSSVPPTVFFVNDDWASHQTFFEGMYFTVTNGATEFEILATNGTGTIEGTWRKSDGVLTHMLMDNIIWGPMDMTGYTIELNLASKVYKPLAVTVGQTLELKADKTDLEVTGTGDFYDIINQTEIQEIQDDLALMKGEVVMRFVVEDIAGCYVRGRGYSYDMDTHTLTGGDKVVFNGFIGSYQVEQPPLWGSGMSYMGGYWAPAITPDWDIYAAQMKLYDYGISTAINDFLLGGAIPEDDVTINNIAGSFELTSKRAFKFFQFAFTADANVNMTGAFGPIPPAVYEVGQHIVAEIEGYTGFHESGIAASLRVTGLISAELYAPGTVTAPTGTIVIEFDIKLRNPDYNPPDPIGRGFIDGFTWIIAIPALFGIAAFAIIARKRK